ncbi:hypothetical protein ACFVEL_22150 [Bacillus thuringiensis]|uniref:hypothetical protein n=1 Tax=Bacillus thuringiensis TaxID=1428 RepID=UPI00366BA399
MTEKEKVIQLYRDILEGKRFRFPNHFFLGDQGKKYLAYITRYLLEEYLSIPIEQIPHCVCAKTLWDYRLRPPAQVHGWNFIDIMQNAYSGTFHPLEFKQVSHGYWKGKAGRKRALEAVRYVIEEKHSIPIQKIPVKINRHFFKQNGLGGVFSIFGDSPYHIIETLYPNQFHPWEFSTVPMNFWKGKENVLQAMEWFLFQKIGFYSYQEALQRLSYKHFINYRMTGLYQMAFDQRLCKVKQWIEKQIEQRSSCANGNIKRELVQIVD